MEGLRVRLWVCFYIRHSSYGLFPRLCFLDGVNA